MTEMKESIYLEDGRKADKIVKLEGDRTVTEILAEPVVEKKVVKRVTELTKPVIYHREIETVNEAGEVVHKDIETTEPEVKMTLREKVTFQDADEGMVSAQSVEESPYVTKDDLVATLKELFGAKATNEPMTVQAQVGAKVADATKSKWGLPLIILAAVAVAAFAYAVFLF